MKQSRDGEVVCQGSVLVRDLCTAGSTAQAYPEIDNTPKTESSVRALEGLVEHILEPIRAHFGSLTITHGFTSLALINRVPRGVARGLDQHCSHELNTRGSRICQRDGASADIYVAGVPSGELARYVHKYLPFDRMYLYGRDCPLHVSHSSQASERQVVLMLAGAGGKRIPRVVGSSDIHGALSDYC
jgi:hypothetical protein